MGIKHEPGEGQHTIVRIEHTSFLGDAVRRVEFEDSDLTANDNIASVGWCIRWALGSLLEDEYLVARELASAVAELHGWIEFSEHGDKAEEKLVLEFLAAAKALTEYRESQ